MHGNVIECSISVGVSHYCAMLNNRQAREDFARSSPSRVENLDSTKLPKNMVFLRFIAYLVALLFLHSSHFVVAQFLQDYDERTIPGTTAGTTVQAYF